jgi:hypothetical protein
MKLKTFFTIKAVITAVFALGFLISPILTWSIFGVSLDDVGVMMTRYLGTAFIAIFFVCWLNRESPPEAQKNATLNLAITDTVGFVVSLVAQLSGLPNALGWIIVLLWLLLAAGNIYFQWIAKE